MTTEQQAELANDPIRFRYADRDWTIDRKAITVDVLEAIDDEKWIRAFRELLGVEQWEAYKTAFPLASDLEPFATAVAQALGNSPASPGS